MNDRLRRAWRFFHENAGWSVPPGKAACALSLAKAEAEASAKGWQCEWSPDECIGCDCGSENCPCCTGEPHEVERCTLTDESGEFLACLGGICGATHEYRRVVEAELAVEASHE